jgi:hypothetical protein
MEVLQRTANRGSISTGFDIDNSCKFEDDNDEYLYRTNASGTNTKTWTVSWWFKQTEVPSTRSSYVEHWQGGVYGEATRAGVDSSDRLWIDVGGGDGNTGTRFRSLSTAKLRDTSAWYHVVIACDSTQSTEADRLKVWLNGVEVTTWDQHQIPTLNFASALAGFGGITMKWGSYDATYNGYSGYLAECHYLDGVTKVQTDFGEFDEDSGIWKPKEYTGTYGTNGTYLDFADAADLGDDASGNSNDYTENNITAADQAVDTPTNNFCTFNPLVRVNNNPTISEGGTKVTGGGGTWNQAFGTLGAKRGKWYYEVKIANSGDTAYYGASTFPAIPDNVSSGQLMYNTSFMVGTVSGVDYYYWQNGSQVSNESTGWGNLAQNDVVGIALDLDASTKTFTIYKNGTALSGTLSQPVDLPTNMQDEFIFPMVVQYEDSGDQYNLGGYTIMSISSAASDANGYGTFEYAPPSGYYALCTKNLALYGG